MEQVPYEEIEVLFQDKDFVKYYKEKYFNEKVGGKIMLDTIKHGLNKIKDLIPNIPESLMFIIKCSVICIIWIALIA